MPNVHPLKHIRPCKGLTVRLSNLSIVCLYSERSTQNINYKILWNINLFASTNSIAVLLPIYVSPLKIDE